MGGVPDEEEEPWWLRDDDEELQPPGAPAVGVPTASALVARGDHPLLVPLAEAERALARLEASLEAASPAAAEGLVARMAYREAAGWLAHAHTWIHPRDLALRAEGLTSSYAAAAAAGRLKAALPSMSAHGAVLDVIPADHMIGLALRLAQLWRRLAEFRTWAPLADAAAVREALAPLDWRGALEDGDIEDWLAGLRRRERVPPLLRAGRAARDWMNRDADSAEPLTLDGMFLAACVWRTFGGQASGFGRLSPLPFWAAPSAHHLRLGQRVGLKWLAEFLDCVARAARAGCDELARLQRAEKAALALGGTARSRLPEAAGRVIRAPVVTARGLARDLRVTPQAASGLLRQLVAAGIVRESTGRASWRAFAVL